MDETKTESKSFPIQKIKSIKKTYAIAVIGVIVILVLAFLIMQASKTPFDKLYKAGTINKVISAFGKNYEKNGSNGIVYDYSWVGTKGKLYITYSGNDGAITYALWTDNLDMFSYDENPNYKNTAKKIIKVLDKKCGEHVSKSRPADDFYQYIWYDTLGYKYDLTTSTYKGKGIVNVSWSK